jgi:hypothetical protein
LSGGSQPKTLRPPLHAKPVALDQARGRRLCQWREADHHRTLGDDINRRADAPAADPTLNWPARPNTLNSR